MAWNLMKIMMAVLRMTVDVDLNVMVWIVMDVCNALVRLII